MTKAFFGAPHLGQTQVSGSFSKGVFGGMFWEGSPELGL